MKEITDWTPFKNRLAFETAEFLFKRVKMSAANIDTLCTLWSVSLDEFGAEPPFTGHSGLYNTIDAIPVGGVPWQSATFTYDGPQPELPDGVEMLKWMENEYEIWFRDPRGLFKNMLANQDFDGSFDYGPFQQYDSKGIRQYENFMSGDWAWKQAVSVNLVFHCCTIIYASRILFPKTPQPMVLYLCPSFLEAIKPLFLLQQVTLSIDPCMP